MYGGDALASGLVNPVKKKQPVVLAFEPRSVHKSFDLVCDTDGVEGYGRIGKVPLMDSGHRLCPGCVAHPQCRSQPALILD